MGKLVDITGNIYGRLTVIERGPNGSSGDTKWKCLCKCGNSKIVAGGHLKNGHTKSCGCLAGLLVRKKRKYPKRNLTGKRFGFLIVLRMANINDKLFNQSTWLCKCDCGNIKEIKGKGLMAGTGSCGCIKKPDLAGQRFGHLVALRLLPKIDKTIRLWECKCDCGNIILVNGGALRRKNNRSCGCLAFAEDITGNRYGRLVVIERWKTNKTRATLYKCLCDCGEYTYSDGSQLRKGRTKSCGCYAKEATSQRLRIKPVTGQRFGHLVVIKDTGLNNKYCGTPVWEYRCDCGSLYYGVPIYNNKRSGSSCGCRHAAHMIGKHMGISANQVPIELLKAITIKGKIKNLLKERNKA